MSPSRPLLPVLAAPLVLVACAQEPPRAPQVALGDPEPAALTFQAVDAGTGDAVVDPTITVRYLVRAPLTLDAAAVDTVPSDQPYRVEHPIAEERLAVEVRVEAPSYHPLDTVLSVPRGSTGGPFTLRLSRKLGARTAATGGRPAGARPQDRASTGTPAGGTTTAPPPATSQPAPASTLDRAAMRAGDEAFARGQWLAAIRAYEGMGRPAGRSGPDADAYARARTRQAVAHINRGEMSGALEALEEALTFEDPGYEAYLRAAQVQCAVGRSEEGRGTLAVLAREVNRMPPAQRPTVNALRLYYAGLCGEADFDRADGTMERVRAAAAAVKSFEDFLAAAEGITPASEELQAAVDDARQRITDIRARIRR